MYDKLSSLKRQLKIESLKSFQRLMFKTQVVSPDYTRDDTTMNRLTHSYTVKIGSELIVASIQINGIFLDYKYAIGNVSLLHDVGQAPFGHDGAYTINDTFKELGVEEGFTDNNNNFVVINKNGGLNLLTDYEVASLIKYPNELYANQKKDLLPLLEAAINEDIKYFKSLGFYVSNRPTRTIACEVMDEADRNAYVCSDLTDALIHGFIKKKHFKPLLEKNYNSIDIREWLHSLYSAIKLKDKSLIRLSFNKLFDILSTNYHIGDNLLLIPKNKELIELREDLYQIEKHMFFKSKHVVALNEINCQLLKKFIYYVIENEYYTSNTYKNLIKNSKSQLEKLTYIRDMVGECSDWFIYKECEKLGIKNE